MTEVVIDPESIDGSFVPRRDDAVQAMAVEAEAILVDRWGGLHVLNPTAGLLWECFDGDVSLAELADEIAAELGVPHEQVLSDTILVVRDFVRRGILDDGRLPVPMSEHDHGDAIPVTDSVRGSGRGPHVLPVPPNA